MATIFLLVFKITILWFDEIFFLFYILKACLKRSWVIIWNYFNIQFQGKIDLVEEIFEHFMAMIYLGGVHNYWQIVTL